MQVTKLGREYFQKCSLNKITPEDLVVRLFMNDYTPVDASVLSDFTQATFTGYAQVTTVPATWVITTPGDVIGTYPIIEFISSAGGQNQTIYGVYLATASTNVIIAAARYSAPQIARPIVNLGDKKTVATTITFS